jgi:pimeloyl-ACP methyl ester carboxylesterase
VVFLAGLTGSTSYWGHAFDALALDHRLVFVDALGFGRSPWPDARYTLDDQLGALRRTLLGLGIDREVTIVAHSFGTVLAAYYAAGHPAAARAAGRRGGMAHDMNDPAMAQTMEGDIRRRFWASLVLSAAVVLLSPLGAALGFRFALSAAMRSWSMLALTSPVVFWGGWIFLAGSYDALRHRRLDMSVLIAIGVLAAYLSSVYLTLIGSSELYYEAAAMLVTFVLFGHSMEMRARRGISDALRALFDLVPPKACVLRDGRELEIPTAEVKLGDILVLRPGDRIPVDGEILDGSSAVDESLVTGESVPVEKQPGDRLDGRQTNGADRDQQLLWVAGLRSGEILTGSRSVACGGQCTSKVKVVKSLCQSAPGLGACRSITRK